MSLQKEQVEKALDEILKDRQFSHLREGGPTTAAEIDPLDRFFSAPCVKNAIAFLDRILRPVSDFLEMVNSHLEKGEIIWYIFTALVLILCVTIIYFLFRALRSNVVRSVTARRDASSSSSISGEPDFEKQAGELEGSHQYQEAMRMLMRALLRTLERRGIAGNLEYSTLREVEAMIESRSFNSVAGPFRSCYELFERRYYAGKPVTLDDFSQFKVEYRQCREMLLW